MTPSCPQCGKAGRRWYSILPGVRTYRFDCCSKPITVERAKRTLSPQTLAREYEVKFEPPPTIKPRRLNGAYAKYDRPQIEPPPRRKVTMPFVPGDLEHALDMLGVKGEAINADHLAETD